MTSLSARKAIFAAVAIAFAAACVRLGFWQLDRLADRTVANAWRAERLAAPVLDLGDGPLPTVDSIAWRRVRLTGAYDYAHEIVLRGRSHGGAPGVQVLTPLRRAAGPAVFVLRGWLPAADGLRADLASGRDVGEAADVSGVALPSNSRTRSPPPRRDTIAEQEHAVMTVLDLTDAGGEVPYPTAGFYVLLETVDDGSLPRPPSAPALDAGPHRVYAIQWFAFALIALGGTAAYLRNGV